MKNTWISPKYRANDLKTNQKQENKIAIFKDRVLGWQLDIAATMAKGNERSEKIDHSGFAICSVLASYFEMIGLYKNGYCSDDQSESHFKIGFKDILESAQIKFTDAELTAIYHVFRCGLYHAGLAGEGILVDGNGKYVIEKDDGNITINPHKLPDFLKQNLTEYFEKLEGKGNDALKRNFENRFNYDYDSIINSSGYVGKIPDEDERGRSGIAGVPDPSGLYKPN